jgi:Asp-tRNA(Asn)/Glu-tRNA(Gln) amidotransferase B subunit
VVAAHPKVVEDYRAGKPVVGFFVGQVMKRRAARQRLSSMRSGGSSTRHPWMS